LAVGTRATISRAAITAPDMTPNIAKSMTQKFEGAALNGAMVRRR
jgi:hypothetical protein